MSQVSFCQMSREEKLNFKKLIFFLFFFEGVVGDVKLQHFSDNLNFSFSSFDI